MDKATLVEQQIQEGKDLIAKFDDLGLAVQAAFWLYDSEKASWKFVLASLSEKLDVQKDTIGAYRTIVDVFHSMKNLSYLSSSDVEIISANHSLIKNFSSLIHTGPGIYNMSFTNTLINNVFVEGLYVYRMNL